MSLIQEALKRKHDGKTPESDLLQSSTSHASRSAGGRHHPALPLVAIVVGTCSLLLVLILMVILLGRKEGPTLKTVQEAPVIATPPVVPPEPVVATPQPKPPAVSEPVVVQAAPQQVVAESPHPAPPPEPVVEDEGWPLIRIMGVLTNPESDSDSVVVNGVIRDPGESVKGVKILRVETKGAWLKFNGETQFVKVGRSYPES